MIYFIQDEVLCRIKIGCGTDPLARLNNLQVGSPSPLTLLATFPGDWNTERVLHERFAEYRLHGEWFRPGPRIIKFLMTLHADPGRVSADLEAGFLLSALPQKLPGPPGRPDGIRRQVLSFLASALKDGPRRVRELRREAHAAGFAWRTLERAKTELDLTAIKVGDCWEWRLPVAPEQQGA